MPEEVTTADSNHMFDLAVLYLEVVTFCLPSEYVNHYTMGPLTHEQNINKAFVVFSGHMPASAAALSVQTNCTAQLRNVFLLDRGALK